MTFSAAVIGLGKIGQGYDYESRDGSSVLTHAGGFYRHPDFDLVAGVDPDPVARARFVDKYHAPAFASVGELYASLAPEVIAIAVPVAMQSALFSEVISHAPRALVCEKPFASDVATSEKMLAWAASAKCPVLVNYIRRFDPGVLELKRILDAGQLGTIFKGVVWYTKGLFNNAAHFVDLMRYLLGEPLESRLLSRGRKLDADIEPDFVLRFGGDAEIYFLAGQAESFSYNQFELLGTEGRLNYARGGFQIEVQRVSADSRFKEYRSLEPDGKLITNDLDRYQLHVLDGLAAHLKQGQPLVSDAESALATLRVLERIGNLVNEVKDV